MNFDWETFTYDEAWLRQAVQLEAEAGIDIEIGSQTTLTKQVDPIQLQSQLIKVRLFSLLFGELRHILSQVDLGTGAEAALIKGRSLIQQRLRSLSSEQARSLESLLTENPDVASEVTHPQATQALFQLFTNSDWQAIADSATIADQTYLLEQITLHRPA